MDTEVVYQRLKSALEEYCKLVAPETLVRNHTHLDDLTDNLVQSSVVVESLEEPGKFVFKRLQEYFPGLRAEGFEPSDKCHHWKRLYRATPLEKVAREALEQSPEQIRRFFMVGNTLSDLIFGLKSGS